MDERIVITGAGLVTALGLDRAATCEAVVAGRCGIGPMTALEQTPPLEKGGGQAPELPNDFSPAAPREVRYLKWAIRAALAEAKALDAPAYPSGRCGFMLGTTLHGMRAAGRFLRTKQFDALGGFLAGATLRHAAEGLEINGPAATTCSACSSSLGSIALAVTMLRAGELDLVIAGGYDTISEYAYAGFNSLRLVAEGPLRPFSRGREGMKLAEGYGIVVLEREADARRRNAEPLAAVLGWGESADAHHLTQPHPEGEGAARAMTAALQCAGLSSRDIDLIAAHATGTPDNDAGEYAALRRVFADELKRVPVVGFKSHLGHTLGGAGACELILSMMALREQIVPACANVVEGETEYAPLQLATGAARPGRIAASLNTSLGFGGANTCVILGPCDSPAVTKTRRRHDVFITGAGVVLPGMLGIAALEAESWPTARGAVAEEQFMHLLSARRVRRMSDYVKLSLAATTLALTDAGITDPTAFGENCSVILGTTHGSTQYSTSYYRQIVDQGIAAANPMLFAEGVPNAGAAHLSLMLSLKGACQTIVGTRTAGLDALRLAALRIACGDWSCAIVGAAEEYDELVESAYQHCGLAGEGGLGPTAAAVTLVLESGDAIERRSASPRARIERCASARGRTQDLVRAADDVLRQINEPASVMTSVNGTWIDRVELAAISPSQQSVSVSTLHGRVGECHSATPLAAIAAVLAQKRLPRPAVDLACKNVRAADGERALDSPFGVLCTDYSGVVSAASIMLTGR